MGTSLLRPGREGGWVRGVSGCIPFQPLLVRRRPAAAAPESPLPMAAAASRSSLLAPRPPPRPFGIDARRRVATPFRTFLRDRSIPNLRHDHLRSRRGPALRFSAVHFVPKGEPLSIRYVVCPLGFFFHLSFSRRLRPTQIRKPDAARHRLRWRLGRTLTGLTSRERCAPSRG